MRDLPDEQSEQRGDERNRQRLRTQTEQPHRSVTVDAAASGYAATMNTGVPMSTRLNSHSASLTCMRMHPCETE